MKKLLLPIMALSSIAALAADGGFLFVTFDGEGTPMSEQIFFGLSKDGRNWEAFDKPNHVIDTDIVRENDKYYRFSKDERGQSITMEASAKLLGPWQEMRDFSLGQLVGYEGPACFQLEPAAPGKPAEWCLLLDFYGKGLGYQPYVTRDLSSGKFAAACLYFRG